MSAAGGWAARVGHVVTAGSCLAGRDRTLGRPGSSGAHLIARRRVRSTFGGDRDRTRVNRVRTRGSYRSAAVQAWVLGRAGQPARSAFRRPSRHRLTAEAAAFIQPTLSIQVVASCTAASAEIDRTDFAGAAIEARRGRRVADAPCGLLRVVVGLEAPRLPGCCLVEPPAVSAAVVLEPPLSLSRRCP